MKIESAGRPEGIGAFAQGGKTVFLAKTCRSGGPAPTLFRISRENPQRGLFIALVSYRMY